MASIWDRNSSNYKTAAEQEAEFANFGTPMPGQKAASASVAALGSLGTAPSYNPAAYNPMNDSRFASALSALAAIANEQIPYNSIQDTSLYKTRAAQYGKQVAQESTRSVGQMAARNIVRSTGTERAFRDASANMMGNLEGIVVPQVISTMQTDRTQRLGAAKDYLSSLSDLVDSANKEKQGAYANDLSKYQAEGVTRKDANTNAYNLKALGQDQSQFDMKTALDKGTLQLNRDKFSQTVTEWKADQKLKAAKTGTKLSVEDILYNNALLTWTNDKPLTDSQQALLAKRLGVGKEVLSPNTVFGAVFTQLVAAAKDSGEEDLPSKIPDIAAQAYKIAKEQGAPTKVGPVGDQEIIRRQLPGRMFNAGQDYTP